MSRLHGSGDVKLILSPEETRIIISALSFARDAYAESADWLDFKGEAAAQGYHELSWEYGVVMQDFSRQVNLSGLA